MKILKDPMIDFSPHGKVRFVILGTMASFVAREINGGEAKYGSFYYHDGRNRFWGVLSLLLTGKRMKFSDIDEKMEFLNSHGVALANLVSTVEVGDEVEGSSDRILFEAFENGRLTFKSAKIQFKNLLETVSVFFSCHKKAEIVALLEGYRIANKIPSDDFVDRITFLHSPTRRGYQYIADRWCESILSSHPFALD